MVNYFGQLTMKTQSLRFCLAVVSLVCTVNNKNLEILFHLLIWLAILACP